MISRYEYQGTTWIDIEAPTSEEVENIDKEFSLGPLLAEELLGPTLKPHVDLYSEFAYAVLHFPAIRHTRGGTSAQEVDIIVGTQFIITVHYEPVNALQEFSRTFEAATLLKRVEGKMHSGHILFEIVQRLYKSVENELEAIEDTVERIEGDIFSGHEHEMVPAISGVSKELLLHKRTLGTHRETLESLERAGVQLFGENFRNHLRGITALHFRLYNRVIGFLDTATELRNTNDSLLSTRQNEIMKNLTIMAFVTFPLTLLASLFGMNTVYTPILGMPHDFWVITGTMAIVMGLFFAYFKKRKWL